jgi:hypothetical protein
MDLSKNIDILLLKRSVFMNCFGTDKSSDANETKVVGVLEELMSILLQTIL